MWPLMMVYAHYNITVKADWLKLLIPPSARHIYKDTDCLHLFAHRSDRHFSSASSRRDYARVCQMAVTWQSIVFTKS